MKSILRLSRIYQGQILRNAVQKNLAVTVRFETQEGFDDSSLRCPPRVAHQARGLSPKAAKLIGAGVTVASAAIALQALSQLPKADAQVGGMFVPNLMNDSRFTRPMAGGISIQYNTARNRVQTAYQVRARNCGAECGVSKISLRDWCRSLTAIATIATQAATKQTGVSALTAATAASTCDRSLMALEAHCAAKGCF